MTDTEPRTLRERIEALEPRDFEQGHEPSGWFYDGWAEAIDVVVALIESEAGATPGLREALAKIANWQTHGPLKERDADAMVALARAALLATPEPDHD